MPEFMQPMDADEYGRALDRMRFSNRGFCHWVGVDERTGRRWLAGDAPVPSSIAALLRIARALKLDAARLRELLARCDTQLSDNAGADDDSISGSKVRVLVRPPK
jgi:hypothetical protein